MGIKSFNTNLLFSFRHFLLLQWPPFPFHYRLPLLLPSPPPNSQLSPQLPLYHFLSLLPIIMTTGKRPSLSKASLKPPPLTPFLQTIILLLPRSFPGMHPLIFSISSIAFTFLSSLLRRDLVSCRRSTPCSLLAHSLGFL